MPTISGDLRICPNGNIDVIRDGHVVATFAELLAGMDGRPVCVTQQHGHEDREWLVTEKVVKEG